MIRLEVVGLPAKAGSKVRLPNGAIVEQGSTARAGIASWRRAVEQAARESVTGPPLTGPMAVWVTFRFPLPSSDTYRVRHSVAPDVDKCARALLDALKAAGVISDDKLVCDLHLLKRYARSQPVGATVEIKPLGEQEAADRTALKATAAEERRLARRA